MSQASVPAGVPPAVEGGVPPPGIPRFKVREQVEFEQAASHGPTARSIPAWAEGP